MDTGMATRNDDRACGATERLVSVLESVSARLEALEQKVSALSIPPRALRIEDAEKYLPIKKSAINALIRRGEIRTARIGKHRYIPMHEIIRLTSVAEPETISAPSVPSKRTAKPKGAEKAAKADADEILAFARSLKRRR